MGRHVAGYRGERQDSSNRRIWVETWQVIKEE